MCVLAQCFAKLEKTFPVCFASIIYSINDSGPFFFLIKPNVFCL